VESCCFRGFVTSKNGYVRTECQRSSAEQGSHMRVVWRTNIVAGESLQALLSCQIFGNWLLKLKTGTSTDSTPVLGI